MLPKSDHPSCDAERLCDLIDVSLLVKRPGLTTAAYAQLGATIASGQDSVPSAFATRLQDVTDGDSFVAFVQAIHCHIFEGAFSFAGQFRREGEEAYVDENYHTVQGTRGGPLVREHLLRMYADVGLSPRHGMPAFARWFARFLQRFFAIHPFADGNGRTARAIVDLVAGATPNIALVLPARELRGGGRARRTYIKALRHAHKHLQLSDADRLITTPRDPFKPLEQWCAARLTDLSQQSQTEEPPEWLDPDGLARLLEIGAELGRTREPAVLDEDDDE